MFVVFRAFIVGLGGRLISAGPGVRVFFVPAWVGWRGRVLSAGRGSWRSGSLFPAWGARAHLTLASRAFSEGPQVMLSVVVCRAASLGEKRESRAVDLSRIVV